MLSRLLPLMAVAVVAAVLAGCGGSSPASSSTKAADSSSVTGSVTSASPTSSTGVSTSTRATTSRASRTSRTTSSATTSTATTSIDTVALREQVYSALQKYVICIRHHGVPNMPPPKSGGNGPVFNFSGTGIDTTSAKFKNAVLTCRSVLIGVLYNRSSPLGG